MTVIAAPDYIDYAETYGSNGLAIVRVRIKIEVDSADLESVSLKVARFLSTGPSSVIEAVMSDRTLNGAVGDAIALNVEWPNHQEEPWIAYVPVQILVNKQGAKV